MNVEQYTRIIKEARERIARLRTDGLPWHIKLEIHGSHVDGLPPGGFTRDSGLEVVIAWSVIDVDTADARTFTLHLPVRPGEDVLDAARRAIRVIALHEIDEQLTVDGVRPWEPHLMDGGGNRRPILKSVEDHAG